MIPSTIDYKITSYYDNEVHFTESDLYDFRVLQRVEDIIKFLFNGKVYDAKILTIDDSCKQLKVELNNQVIDLTLRDNLDQLVDEMGLSDISEEGGGEIHSPMPGLVLNCIVEEGQTVSKGDPLLVLEAMKMENLIQATADGIVAKIHCSKSDSVNKGDLLISITTEA
jgi:biotin carboxyl carrier protein